MMKLKKNQLKRQKKNPRSIGLTCNPGYKTITTLQKKIKKIINFNYQ